MTVSSFHTAVGYELGCAWNCPSSSDGITLSGTVTTSIKTNCCSTENCNVPIPVQKTAKSLI